VERVVQKGNRALLFVGTLKEEGSVLMHQKYRKYRGKELVVKQYQMNQDSVGFQRELKIMKIFKLLRLKDNGRFPIIVSAKHANNYGEILMTSVGQDCYELFKIGEMLLGNKAINTLSLPELSRFAIMIVSQLELLH
jgi:hypothetical protein